MSGVSRAVDSIFPGVGSALSSLTGGADGPGDSGDAMAADEARKSALRRKIDALYGIAPSGAGADDPDAKASADAKAAMDSENTRLSDATRSYYTDELSRQYAKAERNTRFALARQGLLGGSADADEQGEVRTDRNLGATRVDDAVRRAITGLQTQRENERLSAVNLVNSGAGDSAVTAAQRGLQNAFQTSSTQQRADLFGDLFSTAADATSASNMQAQQAAIAAQYRNRLATFFSPGTTGGQITAGSGGR